MFRGRRGCSDFARADSRVPSPCECDLACFLFSRSLFLQDPDALDQAFYIYRLLAPDFLDFLEANHLAFRYELTLSMPVNELLERVVADMAASPSAHTFHTARRATAGAGITTLQPLALISKGRVYHNQVRARIQPVAADMTVGNLAADRNRFAGDVCIGDGRFIIRLGMFFFPASFS